MIQWRKTWKKCRDVLGGEEAVKRAGEEYLPRMVRMSPELYEAYKMRAMFYGASQRTLAGLNGLLLSQAPTVYYLDDDAENTVQQELVDLLQNVDQRGSTLAAFARDIANEVLSVGRVGVLVDAPPADPKLLDQIPYCRFYTAENIINWREHFEGGIPILDQVVLVELISLPSTSGWGVEFILQYRELTLNDDGNYMQRVWVINPPDPEVKDSEATYELVEEVVPTIRGKPLNKLPFFFCSASHLRPEIERPPLLDLYDLNLSHYRSSADLEHGRHFTALPTPVVTGIDTNDDAGAPPSLEIGASTAWLLPSGATARMLEFNGQGLKHLENALSDKESLMTNLGARMLEPDKRASETAEALRLRQAGDIATLTTISDTMSDLLTRVLRVLAYWGNVTTIPDDPNVLVKLDTDYFETRLAPQMLSALVQAWQAGAMGFKDLYYNLLRGETIDPQRRYDDVKAEVMQEAAMRQASLLVKPMQMTDSGTEAEQAS